MMNDVAMKYCHRDKVRDVDTGYEGRVTGFAHYYGIQPDSYLLEAVDSTGRPISEWVTEGRLERVEG